MARTSATCSSHRMRSSSSCRRAIHTRNTHIRLALIAKPLIMLRTPTDYLVMSSATCPYNPYNRDVACACMLACTCTCTCHVHVHVRYYGVCYYGTCTCNMYVITESSDKDITGMRMDTACIQDDPPHTHAPRRHAHTSYMHTHICASRRRS